MLETIGIVLGIALATPLLAITAIVLIVVAASFVSAIDQPRTW